MLHFYWFTVKKKSKLKHQKTEKSRFAELKSFSRTNSESFIWGFPKQSVMQQNSKDNFPQKMSANQLFALPVCRK